MGMDKAFLEWQGRPLWEHQWEKLGALEPAELVLSCRPEQEFRSPCLAPTTKDEHGQARAMPALRMVHDAHENCGPLAGVAACLRACASPRLVVLGVDLPHLPAEFLRTLLAESSDECGAVVRVADYYEPLAAVYPRALLAMADEHLSAGRLAMQEFIRRGMELGMMRNADIPVRAEWFANWNSRRDIASA